MNKQKIEACERLCREFLERANEMRNYARTQQLYYDATNVCEGKPLEEKSFEDLTKRGSVASGALRRTSMELTRALADLRRPG